MLQWLIDVVKAIGKWVIDLIQGVINFFTHVISWFRQRNLDKKKDTPFIMKADDNMKQSLGQAPTKKVGLFEGVYDKNTDEITYRVLDSTQGYDKKTADILGDEKLVVLE